MQRANSNDAKAIFKIGMLYLNYKSGRKAKNRHIKVGIEWLEKSANKNYGEARYALAMIFISDSIVPKNLRKANKYLQEATEFNNHTQAQHTLGYNYLHGLGIKKKDYKKAIHWLEKAKYSIKAYFELGNCYYFGTGVTRDYETAIKYYLKSARQGYVPAQHMLAKIYKCGDGVEQNLKKTWFWCYQAQKCSKDGYSQYMLGRCYLDGIGVKENIEKTINLYMLAIKHGYQPAKFQLECLKRDFKNDKSLIKLIDSVTID